MSIEPTRPQRASAPRQGRPAGKPDPRLTVLVWVLSAGFVVTTILGGFVLYQLVRDATASYTGVGLNPFNVSGGGGGGGSPGEPPPPGAPTPTLQPDVTAVPWDGASRVTVLVMGLDYRDWEAGSGAPRSDTMLLVTIDPITHTAGMLSIPRDLWVDIPGFGHQRINAAYAFGEGYRLPGGGPGLAMQTVEKVIGVPIQYFAVVDFNTFEHMIDQIGGIDVLVQQRIKITPIGRPGLWLEPKAHHLDGPMALAYARVRKGAGDDFGRAERQQQVALAILDRVIGFDMLPTLIRRAPTLYQQLSSGIRTNLTLQEMVSLGVLATRIPRDNIRKGVIGPPGMVGFHTTETGANVLRPVPDQIRQLRDFIFVETSAIGASLDQLVTPAP